MAAPAHTYYPINGVQVKSTGDQKGPYPKVPSRQNIDQWSLDPANKKQVQLFVMALSKFQHIDPADRDSYFQIAGIHGQPNVPWDEPISAAEADGKGYCTHNNILFPVWHRVYLALYEQRIQEIMVKEIIPNFKDQKAEWEEAAATWRLPFWDWGSQNSVPELAKYPTTLVPNDDGTGQKVLLNPLYQFRVPNNKTMGDYKVGNFKDPWVPDEGGEMLYFGDCIGTSRWPEESDKAQGTETWKHGVVNNFKVKESLAVAQWMSTTPYGQAAEMCYRLLTVPQEYSNFATTAQLSEDQSVANDVNLEYIHNNIHGWVGGDFNGHMSQIPVATFDPLFWLHHCNIDRLFALWQGLNPDKWFEQGKINNFFQETIGLPEGTIIGPETPLRPFHRDTKGTLAKPNDVRWTYNFGYTYPELKTWEDKYNPNNQFSRQLFLDDLRKTINDKYGVARKALVGKDSSSLKGVEYLDDMVKNMDFAFSIRYCKYGLGGDPFWIRLYLSTDGATRNPTTDLITEVYNFSQQPETEDGKVACENCKVNQKKNIKVTANISITPVLINIIKSGKDLGSLSRKDVLEYLQKRVYWRVFRNGKEVPRYLIDPLELEVIGTTNDSTNFHDPTKLPLIENFKPEPTLTGGADGALDPALKQPQTVPPPVKTKVPQGTLPVNGSLPFKEVLKADSVVIIDSSRINMTKAKTSGIDNTQVVFTDKEDGTGNILFLLSVRRLEGQIVFNTNINNGWGQEVRISLDRRFRTEAPSILVHDQGDGYEVFIDWVHATFFEKRAKDKIARSIKYTVNENQDPVWSKELTVKVFPSMKQVFAQ